MLHKTKDASSPSHLVVLLCVSSGKNDEDLGSDEEQIVFLAYLLYDVTSNKVSRKKIVNMLVHRYRNYFLFFKLKYVSS